MTEKQANINYPIYCPECNEETAMDEEGVNVWCVNPACPAQLARAVENWVTALDIKGVGPRVIEGLVERGVVKSIPDLYRIPYDDLVAIKGGERAAQIVYEALESKRTIPLATFLQGLGVKWLGRTFSKAIAKEYRDINNVMTKGKEDFLAMDGIGDSKARSFANGLQAAKEMIDDLRGYICAEAVRESTGPMKGVTVCITGSLSQPKKIYHAKVEELGGEAWTSVKAGLTYLVQNEDKESSKSKKAKKLGIEIITEDRLKELLDV